MNKSALLLSALLLPQVPALADDALVRDFRVLRACAGDVEKLCSGILPGEGRIKACMKENFQQALGGMRGYDADRGRRGARDAEHEADPDPRATEADDL